MFGNEYILTSDGELYHYGVLGMKWGVRKNASKAYERSSKKMEKLVKKADKAAVNYGKKAGFHFTDFGVAAEKRARKKSARATGKAVRWHRAMEKEFSVKNLTALEQKYINKGAAYMKKLEAASDDKQRTAYSNKVSKYEAKRNDVQYLRDTLHNND